MIGSIYFQLRHNVNSLNDRCMWRSIHVHLYLHTSTDMHTPTYIHILSDEIVTTSLHRVGAIFLIVMNQAFGGNQTAIELFIKQRAQFM